MRYLFAIGFHDVHIVGFSVENNECKLLIDCDNANHKPNSGKDIIEIHFENATVKKNDLHIKEPYEYYFDRQEIYYLDDDSLMVILGLNNRGEALKTIELHIVADNISIV